MWKAVIAIGLLLSFLFVVPSAKARGRVLTGGRITAVTNTTGNTSVFTIKTIGGTGICANKGIKFSQSSGKNEEVFKRAYAAALTAISAGLLVDVYTYGTLNCTTPSWIRIKD